MNPRQEGEAVAQRGGLGVSRDGEQGFRQGKLGQGMMGLGPRSEEAGTVPEVWLAVAWWDPRDMQPGGGVGLGKK